MLSTAPTHPGVRINWRPTPVDTVPAMSAPDDLHEWISFEDPEEHRTWLFDATYLRSNYTCIYGCGCKGIEETPDPDAMKGCCSFGAHFVDRDDLANVQARFDRVGKQHMQFRKKARKRDFWQEGDPWENEDGELEPTFTTRTVDGACIFLNRPGFEGGVGCALHIAAEAAGERPLDWKPQVCWQVPIRMEDSVDDVGHVTTRIREWKRRDWGDGGEDFGWWCTDTDDAFVGTEPLYVSARDDLVALMGEVIYELLVEQLERPGWVPLPHPAVRR